MTTIILPPTCDRAAAAALAHDLCDALSHGPASIDGSEVASIGQATIQVLISARRTADEAGWPLPISASGPMAATLNLAGVDSLLLVKDGQ